MAAPFDPAKPVQTRDGRKARIIATDRKDALNRSMIALIENASGEEATYSFFPTGASPRDYNTDLVNVPEKHVRWIVAHPGYGFLSKEHAQRSAPQNGISAVVRIEFEEGEGLS